AQPYDAFVLADLVLLDGTPGRMLRIRKLGERVAERGATFFHCAELGSGAPTPVLEMTLGVSDVLLCEILPLFFLVRDDAAHPFRYQLILRVEVAIEGHFI